jgi:Tfp pilus assembly protein PilN
MIRINLLGQIRPKAARRPVDTGAALPVVFIGAGLVLGAVVLGFFYYTWQNQLNKENAEIKRLTAQKTDLEQTKLQVESFEKQKVILQQRVSTIEQLQRDRTGGQELLEMVANTVSRTENLWLTEMVRKGNTLSMEGSSASINAVANFITALNRNKTRRTWQYSPTFSRFQLKSLRPPQCRHGRPTRRLPLRLPRRRRRKDKGAPWPIHFETCP